jgi:hypothetical protein
MPRTARGKRDDEIFHNERYAAAENLSNRRCSSQENAAIPCSSDTLLYRLFVHDGRPIIVANINLTFIYRRDSEVNVFPPVQFPVDSIVVSP